MDEHSVVVSAAPDEAWKATLRGMEKTFAPGRTGLVVRVLGCRDLSARGPRPLAVGSAFPGFHVAVADAPHELLLAGRHRFSDDALILRLDELPAGKVCLRAESRAAFPGAHGTAYRTLVIGSRGHVLAVRRLLASVRRQAERT
ncbi:MAG: hypothetical protein ABIS86_15920 [Streptosporangiaceae bacterium]